MKDDRLRELLIQADKAAGAAPELGNKLAEQVRRRAGQRRRISIAVPAAAAALVLLGVGWVLWINSVSVNPNPNPDDSRKFVLNPEAEVTQLRVEIAMLRAEADIREQIIDELLILQQQQDELAELQAELASYSDPLEEVRQQMEKAAFTMLQHADFRYSQIHTRDSALEDYEQIIKLFPHTPWARVAQDKLTEIRFD